MIRSPGETCLRDAEASGVIRACPLSNDARSACTVIARSEMRGGGAPGISTPGQCHDQGADRLDQRTAPRRKRLMIASRTIAPISDTTTD